jgi:hypothetical protein
MTETLLIEYRPGTRQVITTINRFEIRRIYATDTGSEQGIHSSGCAGGFGFCVRQQDMQPGQTPKVERGQLNIWRQHDSA